MSYSNGPKMVTDGLVMYLDGGNIKSYAGSGTDWYDISGNGNDATLTNGPTYSTDKKGAIVFDGSNDYAYTPNTFNIQGPGTLIFTQKYNFFNLINNYSTIGIGNGSSAAIQIGIQAGVSSVWKYGGTVLLPYNLPTVGTIQTMAVSFDGSNISIYINGVLNNSTTSAANQSGTGNLIMSSYKIVSPDQQFVSMNMYSVQLYNRVLSANEVLQNYNATKGRFGL